jgi:hypothetical protein
MALGSTHHCPRLCHGVDMTLRLARGTVHIIILWRCSRIRTTTKLTRMLRRSEAHTLILICKSLVDARKYNRSYYASRGTNTTRTSLPSSSFRLQLKKLITPGVNQDPPQPAGGAILGRYFLWRRTRSLHNLPVANDLHNQYP